MGSDTETEKKKAPVALAPIAKPLAGKKLCKRTLKLVRRASEAKCLKRGVKEVVKSIRRGNKGLCVIAGNISPIDVITHVPILCEEANIPYIYVPSKEANLLVCFGCPSEQDLATAGTTKRPTCCVLVLTKPTKGEISEEVKEKLKADYDQVAAEVAEATSAMF
ncbi:hypothetical protein PR202_ga02598 [Eleusine coracana subsp. coracana]|uniref:H/ACA ribonucleoprotein complex subunit 2 n=1 Tax=Eleusine coracana subsp. coracana TaxID=191504 RepID=A0AAV5BK64_ELECO|nr:hypothetical protein PR202_ga02598 [Eleusine coracana subsp. coracana]